MRIVLLGHDDIASLYAMHRLISALPNQDFRIYLSGQFESAADLPVALVSLADLDRRFCRQFRSMREIGHALQSADVLANPNATDGLAELASAAPDLIVSIRYRRILKDEAISIPRFGVLNLHSGILPDYRGVMATFWAMLNQEPEIGASLHWIVDAGIDTGPVIDMLRCPTQADVSYLSNVLGLYKGGCAMLIDAIRRIGLGEKPAGAMHSSSDGAYFSTPDQAAIDRFLAMGLTLADGRELNRI